MIVLSFAYPHGSKLDLNYYMCNHMPAVQGVLASLNYESSEVRRDVNPDQGPYQLTLSITFDAAEDLKQFMEHPRIPSLQEDITCFYEGAPQVMIEEVVQF